MGLKDFLFGKKYEPPELTADQYIEIGETMKRPFNGSGMLDERTISQRLEDSFKYEQKLETEVKRLRLLDNKALAAELTDERYNDNYVSDEVLDEVQRRLTQMS